MYVEKEIYYISFFLCMCVFVIKRRYIVSQILESWMIRLEKDSSQMRQQTQLLEIGYKEQIKACIEMLHRCTRPKPKDRPTIEDILLTLEETEARVKLVAGPTSNTVQVWYILIGIIY